MNFSQVLISFIVITSSSLIITDTSDEDVPSGLLNFHNYYTCYFNKYFNVSGSQESERRDKVTERRV